MHTKGTVVKDKRLAQGDATRSALIAAARSLFGEQGYVDTSLDEVVARAEVTKGALYHPFSGKEELFRAVFEQVHREVSDQAVTEFLGPDSWQALLRGCALWVDAHLDPSVRRIVLQDARAVLGWQTSGPSRTVSAGGPARGAAQGDACRRAEPPTAAPLSLLLIGALGEGCLYIAEADDPVVARREVGELVTAMLSAFRLTPGEVDEATTGPV